MHLERRVLVSGGAGFLGSHLCEKLVARGDQVFAGVSTDIAGAASNENRVLSSLEAVLPLKYLVREDGLAHSRVMRAKRQPTSNGRAARYLQLLIPRNPLRLCLLEIEMAAC